MRADEVNNRERAAREGAESPVVREPMGAELMEKAPKSPSRSWGRTQPLKVFSEVRGPELDTAFEVWPSTEGQSLPCSRCPRYS